MNSLNLQSSIGYVFKDPALLDVALTHRSYLNENSSEVRPHNERLEFLGDAVLELAVTEHLFVKYATRPEGELTSFRAAVVRTESLAETALQIKLGNYLYMSKGEESSGGRQRPYILANAVEALIGAIYLDGGFAPAQAFISKYLLVKLTEIVDKRLDIDSKSKLQELAQERKKVTPTYKVVGESGPDHERVFEVEVLIGEEVYGKGSGKSKQLAEQESAKIALKKFL